MKPKWIVILVCILVIFSACSQQTPDPNLGSNEEQSSAPDQKSSEEDAADENETDQTDTSSETQADTPTPTPADTPTTEIEHLLTPVAFTPAPLQRIFDCTTGDKVLGFSFGETCDYWELNRFERPVGPEKTNYYPHLDITKGEFGQDETWYYARIHLFSDGIENLVLDGIYGVEIDLDLDARGEILILVFSPSNNTPGTWSVEGVQVWKDTNDDVGGPQAMQADQDYQGDGYETLLFDSGLGDDPDLAWVQVNSEEDGIIDIAFKIELLENNSVFEWWMWAMNEILDPGKFDLVDFYTEDSIYPLDNTCGWIFGGYPRDLPNICSVITPPKPTRESGPCKAGNPPSADPCWNWDQSNCEWLCIN